MTERDDITRPIIGLENRTPLEVFDIMVDRIRGSRATPAPAGEGMVKRLLDDLEALEPHLLEQVRHSEPGLKMRAMLSAAPSQSPVMLEIAAAADEQRKWEHRWNVLRQLYGHDKHRTDEDGRWCLRDFIDYAGAICGFAPASTPQQQGHTPECPKFDTNYPWQCDCQSKGGK